MSQYQQLLLLARDADLTSPAAQRARALAKTTGAGLHVLGVFEPQGLSNWREEKEVEEQIAEQFSRYRNRLSDVVERLRADHTHTTSQAILSDDPVKDVLDCLFELRPDMVIKDTEDVSALRRVFAASFDTQLVRASPVPVHLVPAGSAPVPKVILAAVDTSLSAQQNDFNHTIIRAAIAMALQCDAQLHLVCAYDISPVFVADASAALDWVEEFIAALREPYDELADAYGVTAQCRHFVQGAPVAVIGDMVRHLAVDVVVMGVVQPKGLGKLLGDTTERIVSSGLCAVLAVNPGIDKGDAATD
ncbi:universal stress protein [Pseudomonas sp. BBP2017]|uniref:universal stress protein n=1 Tax=Pseudomonas sp. BBP2017 TaxID=2109731 RepID=UPI000D11B5AA|nr:universal stress protein [Pseudomonas sp. BBP2017]PSS58714.1 universal stress protein [Pseudomonas sp. BBP2017]